MYKTQETQAMKKVDMYYITDIKRSAAQYIRTTLNLYTKHP